MIATPKEVPPMVTPFRRAVLTVAGAVMMFSAGLALDSALDARGASSEKPAAAAWPLDRCMSFAVRIDKGYIRPGSSLYDTWQENCLTD